MKIVIDELTIARGGTEIVHSVSATAPDGAVTGLIGPNGCGKSTLLHVVAGIEAAVSGQVYFGSDSVLELSRRERAKRVAFVAQGSSSTTAMQVRDVVALGRIAHQDRWGRVTERDETLIDQALNRVGVAHLAHRPWCQLSGGERQRVHLARAFAQDSNCLVLDEPTNHLDVHHQIALLEQLSGHSTTVLIALHDLTLAARYCDWLIMMLAGEIVAEGEPQEVLSVANLREVFGIDAKWSCDDVGCPLLSYRGVIQGWADAPR